jgi:hypothetical protein
MAEILRKEFKIDPMPARTLTWWRYRKDKIDMDPPYQRRGRLWSDTDKAYLIDSILNGYDIPKLYVADFTWGDSALNKQKLPYAIIDGKQRFEAIFDFFEGNITLNDDFVYLQKPELSLGGLGYRDLKKRYPDLAETLDEYNLDVMGVVAHDEEPINELFVRLNRSKSLTGAEIRNAMSGPAPAVIRQIAKHEFFKVNVTFQTKRGQDLNAAAKVLYSEYHNGLKETKKSNLDQFVTETQRRPKEKLELSARKVLDVLADMTEIFLPKDRLLGSAGVFPVYYWFVRTRPEKEFPLIRQFLVRFEESRRKNRELVAARPDSKKVDRQLVEYDQFNRSTNDERSHKGRFRILCDRFLTMMNRGSK